MTSNNTPPADDVREASKPVPCSEECDWCGENMPTAPADDVREALIAAIGYEPVKLSIRDHPEIRYEYRTAEDRDGLVERILAAGFRPRGTGAEAEVRAAALAMYEKTNQLSMSGAMDLARAALEAARNA